MSTYELLIPRKKPNKKFKCKSPSSKIPKHGPNLLKVSKIDKSETLCPLKTSDSEFQLDIFYSSPKC